MRFTLIPLCVVMSWIVGTNSVSGRDETPLKESAPAPTQWLENYTAAYEQAEKAGKLFLIWFEDPSKKDEPTMLDLWDDQEMGRRIERFIPVRVSNSTMGQELGNPLVLSRHPAFAELNGKPGVAIVDLTDEASPQFRRVVSILPFAERPASRGEIAILLDLPAGTLTQRTLIFAVRTHPESPRSTSGQFLPMLAAEAESHSKYQADLMLQGHHHWEQRFHRINGQLTGSLIAQEVCAESWPGQSLFAAARDCVKSWRQSSGHWSAVRAPHPVYGYDMKRGNNGIWYATGVFAHHRNSM